MIKDTPAILEDMARTFRERNAVYGNNCELVGRVMTALFPAGVTLKTEDDFLRWHLLELMIVKITRFAISGLTHIDSCHDTAVYGAMLEAVITPETLPIKINGQ